MDYDIKDAMNLMKEHINTCNILANNTKDMEQKEFELSESKRYQNALYILEKVYRKEI